MLTNPLSLSATAKAVVFESYVVLFWSNEVVVTISPPAEFTANVLPSKSNLAPNLVLGVVSNGLIVCL